MNQAQLGRVPGVSTQPERSDHDAAQPAREEPRARGLAGGSVAVDGTPVFDGLHDRTSVDDSRGHGARARG